MNYNAVKTLNMTLCAMFTALIAVGAFIRIPLPSLPITLQTFFVLLSGLILGGKRGAVSSGLYMILGLAGLPVFTEGGGFSYILKPSFGYIAGFVAGSFITGKISETVKGVSFKRNIIAGLVGLAVIYAIGISYCCFISAFYLGVPLSIKTVALLYILPLIPGDLLLCVFAAYLSGRINPVTQNKI